MVSDPDETLLDPVLLRVQARLRRLMLIGGLTLGLGIVAVLAAVLWRTFSSIPPSVAPVTTSQFTAAGRITLAEMALPPDAKLMGTTFDGARIVLTYAHGAGNTLIFVDPRRLAVLGRLELPAGP
jgi:hypothetical protein